MLKPFLMEVTERQFDMILKYDDALLYLGFERRSILSYIKCNCK